MIPPTDTHNKGDRVTWKPSAHEMGITACAGVVVGTIQGKQDGSQEYTVVQLDDDLGCITIPANKLWRIVC